MYGWGTVSFSVLLYLPEKVFDEVVSTVVYTNVPTLMSIICLITSHGMPHLEVQRIGEYDV